MGLVVPVLNYFVIYWLWRDLSALRERMGQSGFPAGGYVVGAIFLAYAVYKYNNDPVGYFCKNKPIAGCEKYLQ